MGVGHAVSLLLRSIFHLRMRLAATCQVSVVTATAKVCGEAVQPGELHYAIVYSHSFFS